MAGRLQVVLGPAHDGPLVVEAPAVLRAAQQAAQDLAPELLILLADPGFAQRWRGQVAGLGAARVECAQAPLDREALLPGLPVLEVRAGGIPSEGALDRFLSVALTADRPVRWMRQGEVLAVYHLSPESYLSGSLAEARDVEAAAADWIGLQEPDGVRRADQAVFDGLVRDTDGYIARFDRRLSVALSRRLLRTPITPNQVTTAGLLLSLLGAAGLAFGSYAAQVAGVALLWFCCILDGCDGEVARLKLMCSRSGGDYDLIADHIAHLAVFVAIPLAVRAADPLASILLPGVLIVTGAAASGFSVWWLILRRPQKHPGPIQIFVERVASRDYVYLIAVLVVLRKLHWFLWAAAFGAHLFNLALWWLHLRRQGPRAPAAA